MPKLTALAAERSLGVTSSSGTRNTWEAVTAWKEHLAYNPTSIATYYNIANAYAYLLKDSEQAESYYRQFLDLARKEEKPTDKLKEMIKRAEDWYK